MAETFYRATNLARPGDFSEALAKLSYRIRTSRGENISRVRLPGHWPPFKTLAAFGFLFAPGLVVDGVVRTELN